MPDRVLPITPSDQEQRLAALATNGSFLVEAPAGSGKTDLLTRRFLRLLAEVEDPAEVVAITFTKAAAAEMRHRILAELENAARHDPTRSEADLDFTSMAALAHRAWLRAQSRDWRICDLPGRLRIETIDAFCREVALQQPLISGLGAALDIHDCPEDLYRVAARRALEGIESGNSSLRSAIATLLLWRDNNWPEMEDLLVDMLAKRDKWMHGFVVGKCPDEDALRQQLEKPFLRAIRSHLIRAQTLLEQIQNAPAELIALGRFASHQTGGSLHAGFASESFLPAQLAEDRASVAQALTAWQSIASLLLTKDGTFRKTIDKKNGFPPEARAEKDRFKQLLQSLSAVDGLEDALAYVPHLPPMSYSEDEWNIVRACFTLLSHAAAELRVVFAEAGTTDFTEIAQIAQNVLQHEDGSPSDAAIEIAGGIRHILVDEFQDTSRLQHRLLASLILAWQEDEQRTLFVVGDPKQSIYFFRNADAELFPRVARLGLETTDGSALGLERISLSDNFRTAPSLIDALNRVFSPIFAEPDGTDIAFSDAVAARSGSLSSGPVFQIHTEFMPPSAHSAAVQDDLIEIGSEQPWQAARAEDTQLEQMTALIREHAERVENARASGQKYRIAVLGRTRAILAKVADELRRSAIPFYAVELEKLQSQPEIQDALALGRALLNPYDRVAWLGVLRAPWCGLALDDLFTIAGTDGLPAPFQDLPSLLRERFDCLSQRGQPGARRVIRLLDTLPTLIAHLPNATLGTWLKRAWLVVEGYRCVDAAGWANLELLWRSLDRIRGTQGFLGSELDSVLQQLTALPHPDANADCGVQLMTIHKSKGLEFEVVLVPDLQAGTFRRDRTLLSWLERGLVKQEASGAITEFLVAPIQTKGAKGGLTKKWVDREIRIREDQEMRRIFYVAATRAREELHLFARPSHAERDGDLHLSLPSRSLLMTAWPGVRQQVEDQFNEWKRTRQSAAEPLHGAVVDKLAASGAGDAILMPRAESPAVVRRLPGEEAAPAARPFDPLTLPSLSESQMVEPFARHEGGWYVRALGNAVHSLFDLLAKRAASDAWGAALAQLSLAKPRLASKARASGAAPPIADALAEEAVQIALDAAQQAECKWILSPHPQAEHEVSWTGEVEGKLRNVRIDRLFLAGDEPLSDGESTLWIIDYKTTHDANSLAASGLAGLRAVFAPQLELYGRILGHGYPSRPIHAGLYYPRLHALDWWKIA